MTDVAFDPTRVSPSRLNSYVSCGISFRMKYIEQLPEERSGSAALFGNVNHRALELWGPDRSQDLTALMRAAWLTETEIDGKPSVVTEFIKEYQSLSVQAIKQEHAIREAWKLKGKESKKPRMTADWKKSEIGRKLAALQERWFERLNTESHWRFNEYDPLPSLYDESLVISKRYAHAWGHLPNSLYSEFKFEENFRGFTIIGFIDSVELLLDKVTKEILGVGILDYKTYGKEPAEFKDWRQVTMYDAVFRALVDRGAIQLPVSLDEVPLYVGIDYVRGAGLWEEPRRFWRVEEADYDRLERELNAYKAGVENDVFLPAEKGRNPDFCDFPSNCCLRCTSAAGGSSPRVEIHL